MGHLARYAIYLVAGAALAVGILAYATMGEEHDEEGLIAGDLTGVAVVGGILAAIAVMSLAYLAKRPGNRV